MASILLFMVLICSIFSLRALILSKGLDGSLYPIPLSLFSRNTFRRTRSYSSFLAARARGGFGSKAKNEVFVCEECGVEHINFVGRCTSCQAWNTVKPIRLGRLDNNSPLDARNRPFSTGELIDRASRGSTVNRAGNSWLPLSSMTSSGTEVGNAVPLMIPMSDVDINVATQRMDVWSGEMNRVLGGGLVRGSVLLLAGEPGIGKSTLLLQLCSSIASGKGSKAHVTNENVRAVDLPRASVVYISGEENKEQIAARAARLQLSTESIFLMCATDTDLAIESILQMESVPALIIVDSIQTMRSSTSVLSAGSVAQIRESTALYLQLAKSTGSTVLLVGHVTKSGDVAGPRVLEHMVDTVLYLEGSEKAADLRLLRAMKNRFGSTSEVGVMSMSRTEGGLMEDVSNPSELFLSGAVLADGVEGAAVAVLMEGTRPLLAEIQCLVGGISPMKSPRRASDGFPLPRLQLICALLQKRLGGQASSLSIRDVYLNVVGGLKVSDPDADLAVAVTIASSLLGVPVRPGIAFIGELGLGGEVRGGSGAEFRAREALQLGFKHVLVPTSALSKPRRQSKGYRRRIDVQPNQKASLNDPQGNNLLADKDEEEKRMLLRSQEMKLKEFLATAGSPGPDVENGSLKAERDRARRVQYSKSIDRDDNQSSLSQENNVRGPLREGNVDSSTYSESEIDRSVFLTCNTLKEALSVAFGVDDFASLISRKRSKSSSVDGEDTRQRWAPSSQKKTQFSAGTQREGESEYGEDDGDIYYYDDENIEYE